MESFKFTKSFLEKGMNYTEYRNIIADLFSQGKYTGNTIKDSYLGFTELNIQRMNRADKTMQVDESNLQKLSSLKSKQIWVLIAEGWCGDCAQIIPAINKLAQALPDKIELKIFLRDDNDSLMNAYLTNGGRSIPKLIFLDAETLIEKGTWGSRPFSANEIANHWKQNKETISKEEFEQQLHLWYGRNRGVETMNEIATAVEHSVEGIKA